MLSFATVGGVGFLIDVGTFNLLRLTVLAPEHVHGGPVYAKVISVSLAIAANWIGNRAWTFRDSRRPDVLREAIEFALVSIAGSAVAVGCLVITHYGLHLTSALADNISTNVIGLALGSALRFVAYRYWIFADRRVVQAAPAAAVRAL